MTPINPDQRTAVQIVTRPLHPDDVWELGERVEHALENMGVHYGEAFEIRVCSSLKLKTIAEANERGDR